NELREHLVGRMRLFESLQLAYREQACIGCGQFVYFDASDPKKCLSPDVFVRLGVQDEGLAIWKVWERGAPQSAVESRSNDDRPRRRWAEKFARYRALGVLELVSFDPKDGKLRIWDRVQEGLVERDLVELASSSPHSAECGPLGLFWVVVDDP